MNCWKDGDIEIHLAVPGKINRFVDDEFEIYDIKDVLFLCNNCGQLINAEFKKRLNELEAEL